MLDGVQFLGMFSFHAMLHERVCIDHNQVPEHLAIEM